MNTLNSCKMVSFIPCANLSRAKEFYRHTLGFYLLSEGAFGLMFEVSGELLRVFQILNILEVEIW